MNNPFKTHAKTILAVVGAFLMLTFTLPSFFSGGGDNGTTEVGRLDGKKVTAAEISSANQELRILSQFQVLPGVLSLVDQDSDNDRGAHWYLMVREAMKVGIVASTAEVSAAVNAGQRPAGELESQLQQSGLSQHDLKLCATHAVMVYKLAVLALSGTQTPVPEIEYLANEELSTVRLQYAIMDGTIGWQKAPQPAAEAIQKQFDLYKDVVATPPDSDALPPTIDGHTYPFGYKYPNRVQVEYLRFDRAALLSRFQPTRDDYQEAYKYYSTHLDEFKKTDANAMTVGGTKSFDEMRDQLVKTQVGQRIDKFLARVTERVLETTKMPWNNAKVDSGGFRETIPTDKWADYPAIVKELQESKEFNNYAPEYVKIGAWQDRDALAKDAGIGEAYYENPTGQYPFADLAMHVHELNPPKDNFPRLFSQVGIEGPVLKDEAGNMYIYRVTDAQLSHAPKTMDEVRGQVMEDLQKLATYQVKQAGAKSLAAAAASGDLSTLATAQGLSARTIPDLTHVGEDFPDVRKIPGLVNAAFDLARKEAATQPAATQGAHAPKPTTSVNVDSKLEIAALALDDFKPVSPTAFAANRGKYMNAAEQHYGMVMRYQWLSLQAVAKRMKYVPRTPFEITKDTGDSSEG